MLGVCTIWSEDFVLGLGNKRWYNLYKQPAKAFGATHLFWIEVAGTHRAPVVADREIVTECYDYLADLRATYPDATIVFLDVAEGSMCLEDFTHPPGDVIYVVGTDSDGLGEHLVPEEDDPLVRVSTTIELWSHMTLAVALYDRQAKGA